MKTFKDLVFKDHEVSSHFSSQARMDFDNGYGVSVITGRGAYSDDDHPYEVAILFDGELTYNTHITDDVIGYQKVRGVTNIMKKVQLLK